MSDHNRDTQVQAVKLLKQWRDETGGFSLARQKQYHPTYLRIIGMGEKALPFLLDEVSRGRKFLFVALESIANENPAADASTFEEAAAAWLAWGKVRPIL